MVQVRLVFMCQIVHGRWRVARVALVAPRAPRAPRARDDYVKCIYPRTAPSAYAAERDELMEFRRLLVPTFVDAFLAHKGKLTCWEELIGWIGAVAHVAVWVTACIMSTRLYHDVYRLADNGAVPVTRILMLTGNISLWIGLGTVVVISLFHIISELMGLATDGANKIMAGRGLIPPVPMSLMVTALKSSVLVTLVIIFYHLMNAEKLNAAFKGYFEELVGLLVVKMLGLSILINNSAFRRYDDTTGLSTYVTPY